MAEVRITVDTAGTDNQLIVLSVMLREAVKRGSHKGAEAIKNRAQELLSALSHAPETRTPSPPGSPPARISGELADTIRVTDFGVDGSDVGPTAHYGRFLELGGIHEGNMRWFEDGQLHEAKMLVKAPRPYMLPAREAALTEIHEIVSREVNDAIREALSR